MTEPEIQDRGEYARQAYGIEGTAEDAQAIPHPFTPDLEMGISECVACETGLFSPSHEPVE